MFDVFQCLNGIFILFIIYIPKQNSFAKYIDVKLLLDCFVQYSIWLQNNKKSQLNIFMILIILFNDKTC